MDNFKSATLSGRTRDAELHAYCVAKGRTRSKWIENVLWLAMRTEQAKGIDMFQVAQSKRESESEQE